MYKRFEEILTFALASNSTDIHLEYNLDHNELSVSFRTLDGFKEIESKALDKKVIEYLKYVGNLNLIDSDKPQSGAFTYFLNHQEYYFRVASIKTQFVEVCVVRILNKFYISDDIFEDINLEIESLLTRENGLIIFSGPTGSGKTTSLYSLMNKYNNKKVYSIEDPIEIYFNNIVQIDVNEQRGFGYKEAISQVLRHDPDIICIGEIRDENAARMAIRASYTGHLILCTIHATDCIKTLERLRDLGVSEQELNDNVIFIANQRLKVIDNNRKSIYETMVF